MADETFVRRQWLWARRTFGSVSQFGHRILDTASAFGRKKAKHSEFDVT
jgi:hypothetical protein